MDFRPVVGFWELSNSLFSGNTASNPALLLKQDWNASAHENK